MIQVVHCFMNDASLQSISDWERARYFLRYSRGPWSQVTEAEFIAAERSAGFVPKPDCGPVATAGFSCNGPRGIVAGRIEYDNLPEKENLSK